MAVLGKPVAWGRDRARLILCALCATWFGTGLLGQAVPVRVIENDRGGYIGARAIEIGQINGTGARVELRGRICYSACTMYLGADDVCVSETTTFGFHGPSQQGRPLAPRQFEHWSEVMAAHYNAPLRDWFMREARYRINGYYRVTGESLIALGYPRC